MPFVEVDGLKVHYLEEGEGPTVVLIHGWGMSSDTWSEVVPALAPRYRCLALDLPGYGLSEHTGRVSVQDYTEVVGAFCREVGRSGVTLIGHSMGGMITLLMALEYPQCVRRLATVGAAITGDLSFMVKFLGYPGLLLASAPWVGPRLYSMTTAVRPYMRWMVRNGWYYDPDCTERPYFPRRMAVWMDMSTMDTRLGNWRSLTGTNLLPRLGAVTVPALLIHGDNDGTVPPVQAHQAAQRMPNAELKIISKASHWPMDEQREQVLSALTGWLERTAAAVQ